MKNHKLKNNFGNINVFKNRDWRYITNNPIEISTAEKIKKNSVSDSKYILLPKIAKSTTVKYNVIQKSSDKINSKNVVCAEIKKLKISIKNNKIMKFSSLIDIHKKANIYNFLI